MKVYCVFENSCTPLADYLKEIFKNKEDAELFAKKNEHNDYYVEERELIEGKLS